MPSPPQSDFMLIEGRTSSHGFCISVIMFFVHSKSFKNNSLDHFKLPYVPEVLLSILHEWFGAVLQGLDHEQNKSIRVKINKY